MRKRILATALTLVMLLAFAFTATAAGGEVIEGSITTPGFFSEVTNTVPLKSGDGYTFKFHNKSNGYTNWENFILAVSGASDATGFDQALLILRADSFGWGDGIHFPTIDEVLAGDTLPFVNNVTDWESFMMDSRSGFDVTVTIQRDGDTLLYTAQMNEYTVTLTAVSKAPLPETVYVFLTGENCVLTGITSDNSVEPGAFVTDIRGDLTVTSFLSEKTAMLPLRNGDSYTLKFHNQSNGATNWENFILAVTGPGGVDQAILILRADSFGWGDGEHFPTIDEVTETPMPFETDITDWEAFVAEAQAGFDVTLTIVREGNTLLYTANMGGHSVKLTAQAETALPDTVYVLLSGENCILTGISCDDSVSVAGNLTVTDFFSAQTAALPLKTGESYEFTFHNKSDGSTNWENFILGVAGAPAATGFDEALLILRADSYGWGDGSHFPTIDEVSGGDILPFETDINDWEAFVQEAQAGFDVTVTLTREGDTLVYDANMGGHSVKLTAQAKAALPETVYVFLTGEKCVLSDIASQKSTVEPTDPTDPEPPTESEPSTEPDTPSQPEGPTAPDTPSEPDAPKDNQDSGMNGLWIALIVVAVLAVAVVVVVIVKKSRNSRKK